MDSVRKCELHEEEILKINTEFGTFKKDIDTKLEDLFEEVKKPLLTINQASAILIPLLIIIISGIIYVANIKEDGRLMEQKVLANETKIEKLEILKREEALILNAKIDKIYELVVATNTSVAVLENTSQIEKNKQKVRSFVNN